MSQTAKSPAVMVRIERALEELIEKSSYREQARLLIEEGRIDIEWAAEHTRLDAIKAELASRASSISAKDANT